MQKIFVLRDNQQTGPFTEANARTQLASGTISGSTLVWWEGLPEWQPLSRTPLMIAMPTVPAPPATQARGVVPSVGTIPGGKRKNCGLAIASLVSGIIGIVFVPLSILAIVTGHTARSKIHKDPSLKGGGMALAGLILGYVWAGVVVICVVIALGNQARMAYGTGNAQPQENRTNNASLPGQ
jgi:hypothetical protein